MDTLLTHTAPTIAIACAGIFFMSGLLTGAWKYLCMTSSPDFKAPFYVDTAHRASLMYAFAALLVAVFAYYSDFPAWLNIAATVGPLLFFGLSILLYIKLGLENQTDNNLRDDKSPATTRIAMRLLMLAEIGGFGVLLLGFFLRLAKA
ncbi:MAG: hypothetical protein ACE5E4_01500 [Candidatus Binatia bacterium]